MNRSAITPATDPLPGGGSHVETPQGLFPGESPAYCPPPASKDINPYAPPESSLAHTPVMEILRRGPLLVVPRASAPYLPRDTCFQCGRPAVKLVDRILSWHSPRLYFLLLPLVLPYFPASILTRKKLGLRLGLCSRHAGIRRRRLVLAWLSLFLTAGVLALELESKSSHPDGSGFPLACLCLIPVFLFAWLASTFIRARRITREQGEFAGAGEDYLKQFPETGGN